MCSTITTTIATEPPLLKCPHILEPWRVGLITSALSATQCTSHCTLHHHHHHRCNIKPILFSSATFAWKGENIYWIRLNVIEFSEMQCQGRIWKNIHLPWLCMLKNATLVKIFQNPANGAKKQAEILWNTPHKKCLIGDLMFWHQTSNLTWLPGGSRGIFFSQNRNNSEFNMYWNSILGNYFF